MKFSILCLLLAICPYLFALDPQVENGQVVRSLPIPDQNGDLSVDFSLLQSAGGVADGNFAYEHPRLKGAFALDYTGGFGCEDGCTFMGNFTKWNKPETTIFGDCTVYSGELSGNFVTNGVYHYDVQAFYSQVFCGIDGYGRYAGGDFTVNIPPAED